MKKEDLYRAINEIDDSYIIDAQRFPGRKPPTVRWIVVRCALAAVLAVAILTGILWSAGNSATFLGFQRKFLRISYNNGSLGNPLGGWVGENTTVINELAQEMPAQLPIYKISERKITQAEFEQLQEQLGVSAADHGWLGMELDGNSISGTFVPTDSGFFSMSDEELEKLAWETFEKIPFMEGEFEYIGIAGGHTTSSSEGEIRNTVMVAFCRLLDGVRVVGIDRCYLWFNDSGLVAIDIDLYEYEQIGTMDLISLQEIAATTNKPDTFSMDESAEGKGQAETLQVDRVKLLLVNQHYRGCTILQPVYNFIGTATFADGSTAKFTSKVIAIPEKYTYEDPFDR